MKCRECIYMSDFGNGLYRCTNHDSTNYMIYTIYTGVYCEDECADGEYLSNKNRRAKHDESGSSQDYKK